MSENGKRGIWSLIGAGVGYGGQKLLEKYLLDKGVRAIEEHETTLIGFALQYGIVLVFLGLAVWYALKWSREKTSQVDSTVQLDTWVEPRLHLEAHEEKAPERLLLREAAKQAYESLRESGSIWATAAESASSGGPESSKAEAILRYMAHVFVTHKVNIYGTHPPSERVELIPNADLKRGDFYDNLRDFKFHNEEHIKYSGLSTFQSEVVKAIAAIRASDLSSAGQWFGKKCVYPEPRLLLMKLVTDSEKMQKFEVPVTQIPVGAYVELSAAADAPTNLVNAYIGQWHGKDNWHHGGNFKDVRITMPLTDHGFFCLHVSVQPGISPTAVRVYAHSYELGPL